MAVALLPLAWLRRYEVAAEAMPPEGPVRAAEIDGLESLSGVPAMGQATAPIPVPDDLPGD
jgi:hypothetical protein